MAAAPPIVVRQVWESNLAAEFEFIQSCSEQFQYVSIDTEYPGIVFGFDIPKHELSTYSLAQYYSLMKTNVDALGIIQLGLTLSDPYGNHPRFVTKCGTEFQCVWEFNFRDFDIDGDDLRNKGSIELLEKQGINFSVHKKEGIDSHDFARYFLNSWLSSKLFGRAWVTFHGLYDFGFLIKVLTRRALPDDLKDFMTLVEIYFGLHVYDLKSIAYVFGLHGGLEMVAKSLGLDRAAGESHQAGSDSLLTMHAFLRLVMGYYSGAYAYDMLLRFNYMLYALTIKF